MGWGSAMPHGAAAQKARAKNAGIVGLQYPEGTPFGEEKANLVFGIAGVGEEHIDLLSNICSGLEDDALMNKLKTTDDVAFVLRSLQFPES